MDIREKLLNAKSSDWMSEEFTKAEMKSMKDLSRISASLEMKRVEMGMTQKEFAVFMGVSQAMVSKWESREYNFTISTLNEICEKLGMSFEPTIREAEATRFEQIDYGRKSRSEIRNIARYVSGSINEQNRGIA